MSWRDQSLSPPSFDSDESLERKNFFWKQRIFHSHCTPYRIFWEKLPAVYQEWCVFWWLIRGVWRRRWCLGLSFVLARCWLGGARWRARSKASSAKPPGSHPLFQKKWKVYALKYLALFGSFYFYLKTACKRIKSRKIKGKVFIIYIRKQISIMEEY